MGFIFDGLDTESYDRTYSDRELVRRIIGYFRPHSRQMALVAALLTLTSVTSTGGPILIARAIDVAGRDPSPMTAARLAGAVLRHYSFWDCSALWQPTVSSTLSCSRRAGLPC